MSHQLINLNPCLSRLRDEGYEIEIRGSYILVHSVPYVNSEKKVLKGTLITNLVLESPDIVGKPNTHQMYFTGEHPCHPDGKILTAIQHSSPAIMLTEGIVGEHWFSNKPPSGCYEDYYHQIISYVRVISNQARAIDENVTAKTFIRHNQDCSENTFLYQDTASARIGTVQLNERFSNQKIAIIGLGGTGSYILDLVAKTCVSEIHLYDKDQFQQHNAFRAPGAASDVDLAEGKSKCEYYHRLYSKFRMGILPHTEMITNDNIHQLSRLDFVFISIDNAQSRRMITDYLAVNGISFIDVGMGLDFTEGKKSIFGTCRTTVFTPKQSLLTLNTLPTEPRVDEVYKSNIQLVELNCLNAALAVIQWKKVSGFYCDDLGGYEMTYCLGLNKISCKLPESV